MKKLKLFFLGSVILSFFNCSEEVMEPQETENLYPPEKLYPYETFYDEETFKLRRDNLIQQIPDNSFVVIATNETYLRNGDVDYEFRPASNFFYLTGFDESNAVAVVKKKTQDPNTAELVLFVETRDERTTQWSGPVYGLEGAMEYFAADSAFPFEEFGSYIRTTVNTGKYNSIYANLETNQSVDDSLNQAVGDFFSIFDVNPIVDSLRAIKSAIEISSIQKAVDVSVQAFSEAMRLIKPGMYEYEVEAIFDYILGLNGCQRSAYPSIVASGPNINILHYQANNRQMSSDDLIMIDFGAEYGYYASDITRTLPVDGKFSIEQATVYNIVLEAHQTVINQAAPGVSYYYLYTMARDIVINRLLENGIISGKKSEIISSNQFRQYIPAGLGHCVGLDVHDPFPREENGDRILKENMVLAIEPHIYLYEGDQTVHSDYWNVSVRIEDDILITANGCVNMSSDLQVKIVDIENIMR